MKNLALMTVFNAIFRHLIMDYFLGHHVYSLGQCDPKHSTPEINHATSLQPTTVATLYFRATLHGTT